MERIEGIKGEKVDKFLESSLKRVLSRKSKSVQEQVQKKLNTVYTQFLNNLNKIPDEKES